MYSSDNPGSTPRIRKTKLKLRKIRKTLTIRDKQKNKYKMRCSRQKRKIQSFKTLITTLKEERLIDDEFLHKVTSKFTGVQKSLFHRLANGINGKYDDDIMQFAFMLDYHSPAAYQYVRRIFGKKLPSKSLISKRYSNVDGKCSFFYAFSKLYIINPGYKRALNLKFK